METSKQQNNNEGYIKFNLHWEQKKFDFSDEQFKLLNTTREKLYQLNLIGAYTGGIGYGNISIRQVKNRFIISGSATGNFSELKKEHYALVDKFNINENVIHCIGLSKASSESLSHAAIYATNSVVNAVIHVHHKKMWEQYVNKLPTSNKKAEFGTPEIAREIQRLANTNNGIIIMGGHPDGVITYGETLELAYHTLIKYYKKIKND